MCGTQGIVRTLEAAARAFAVAILEHLHLIAASLVELIRVCSGSEWINRCSIEVQQLQRT